MKLSEQYDGHTFCHSWEMPKDRIKEEWIEALGRSTNKPRKEYFEERTVTIRALQGHSHGVAINPNLFPLKQIPLGWKEHIFHTGSSFNHNSVPEKDQWAGGLSLRSARQASFFSALNAARIVIATAYDRLERTR